MLDDKALKLDDGALAARIRDEVSGLEEDLEAPEAHRDLALLFELDHQVRNGGFAQYFFNASCVNSFDAWFAATAIDAVVQELLELALLRIGAEFGIDLEVGRLVTQGGERLGEAYGQLLAVYHRVHQHAELLEAFAAFRDRLAHSRDGVDGLEELSSRFYAEVDVDRAIVAYVREHTADYLTC